MCIDRKMILLYILFAVLVLVAATGVAVVDHFVDRVVIAHVVQGNIVG